MRRAALLLIFCVPVLASEEVLLHAFKIAREDPFSPQGRSRMDRAIESMSAEGGVQCAEALGEFLRVTHTAEAETRTERLAVERRGRTAHNGIQQVQRELEHLRARENAGATDVGPKITARENKLESMNEAVALAKSTTLRLLRIHEQILQKREAASVACAHILTRLKPEEVATVVAALRRSLEVDKPDQVLGLVRVLRQSKRKEASSALLEIFSHPKTGPAGRTVAACAIAYLNDPATIKVLVRRLRQGAADDEAMDRARILHALGLAARQRFEDFDSAAKWSESLE